MPSSSCGQEDSDCNESGKEFDEANDDRLEDGGQHLMWYDRPTQDVDSYRSYITDCRQLRIKISLNL